VSAKFIKSAKRLAGRINIPGDKSISHRAAILGMLAEGQTHITHYLAAEDCLNTLRACELLGAKVERRETDVVITGRGLKGLVAPDQRIDCGNSGTGVRLLSGVLAGQPFASTITGDAQVQRRPMNRIIKPLESMGAKIQSEPGGFCPLRIEGGRLQGITYHSPVASAQVKSCLLLAGLFAEGETTIISPAPSRDHTEKMMNAFGVAVRTELYQREGSRAGVPAFGEKVTLPTGRVLQSQDIEVPADISSAAFFLVAAALLPDSDVRLANVGVSPSRDGILTVLADMGADVIWENRHVSGGEEIADLTIHWKNRLRGTQIWGEQLIPRLIDEIPILAVAAAMADGETVISNAAELRVKETDRISVLAYELRKIGVAVEDFQDGLRIQGGRIRGGEADSHGDHRLAMSLAVAGLVSEQGVWIRNTDCVNTSFPGFWDLLEEVRID
jgi:3-phosphoshikimate 1-carboxyvinyltransferase